MVGGDKASTSPLPLSGFWLALRGLPAAPRLSTSPLVSPLVLWAGRASHATASESCSISKSSWAGRASHTTFLLVFVYLHSARTFSTKISVFGVQWPGMGWCSPG